MVAGASALRRLLGARRQDYLGHSWPSGPDAGCDGIADVLEPDASKEMEKAEFPVAPIANRRAGWQLLATCPTLFPPAQGRTTIPAGVTSVFRSQVRSYFRVAAS